MSNHALLTEMNQTKKILETMIFPTFKYHSGHKSTTGIVMTTQLCNLQQKRHHRLLID